MNAHLTIVLHYLLAKPTKGNRRRRNENKDQTGGWGRQCEREIYSNILT